MIHLTDSNPDLKLARVKLGSLYSRKEEKEYEDAQRATITCLHIADWLSAPLGFNVAWVGQTREADEESGKDVSKGIIRVLRKPSESRKILEDMHLKPYTIRIFEGTNFNQSNNPMKWYALQNGKWPHPDWQNSYKEFVDELKRIYPTSDNVEGLLKVTDGEWINSMILKGSDLAQVSNGRVYIRLGEDFPPQQKTLLERLRIKPKVIRIR